MANRPGESIKEGTGKDGEEVFGLYGDTDDPFDTDREGESPDESIVTESASHVTEAPVIETKVAATKEQERLVNRISVAIEPISKVMGVEPAKLETLNTQVNRERADVLLDILESLIEAAPVFQLSEDQVNLLKTPLEMREAAELLGALYLYSTLVDEDPVLAEELRAFYCRECEDVKELVGRIEAFYEQNKETSLTILTELLAAEKEDKNNFAATYLLRGMLRPYFDVSDTRNSGFWSNLFHEPLESFTDLKDQAIEPFQTEFLKKLLPKPAEGEGTQETTTETESEQTSKSDNQKKLEGIVASLKQGTDILTAIESFVDNVEVLSIRDLHRLLELLPSGQNWGERNNFEGVKALIPKKFENYNYGLPTFESADIRIVLKALKKTNDPAGSNLCGAIGDKIRGIFKKSRFRKDDQIRNDLKARVSSGIINEFQSMVSRNLIESEQETQ